MFIGEMLTMLRKDASISETEVYAGICRRNLYQQYEKEERIPDPLSVNAFLERIGYSEEGLSAYVSEQDMEYMEWRHCAGEALLKGRYELLEEMLEKEPKADIKLHSGLREQYRYYLKAVVFKEVCHNLSEAERYLRDSIDCTCPFVWNENFARRLGVTEALIYAMYLVTETESDPKQSEEMAEKLKRLIEEIDRNFYEDSAKARVYPQLVCLLRTIPKRRKMPEKEMSMLRRAYELLCKERLIHHMLQILLELTEVGRELSVDVTGYEKKCSAVKKLYRRYGVCQEFAAYQLPEMEMMYETVSEYLKYGRYSSGLTQEKASEDIVAVESYSRIETGKNKPSRKNYHALTRRLGIKERYYVELLQTGNIKALKKRKEISRAMYERDFVHAKILLKELEELLGEEATANRQYLEYRQLGCNIDMRNTNKEQCCLGLQRALEYTMKVEEIGQAKHVYTKLEINIINQLAVQMDRLGQRQEAYALLENFLSDIEKSNVSEYLRFHQTFSARLCVGRFLSDMGRYRESDTQYDIGIRATLEKGRAYMLDSFLAERAFNQHVLKTEKSTEEAEKLFLIALEISKMYGPQEMQQKIFRFILKNYGDILDQFPSSGHSPSNT